MREPIAWGTNRRNGYKRISMRIILDSAFFFFFYIFHSQASYCWKSIHLPCRGNFLCLNRELNFRMQKLPILNMRIEITLSYQCSNCVVGSWNWKQDHRQFNYLLRPRNTNWFRIWYFYDSFLLNCFTSAYYSQKIGLISICGCVILC